MRRLLAILLALPLLSATSPAPDAPAPALAPLAFEQIAPAGTKMPRFMVDAAWPAMPPDLLLGQVSGVAVGPDDSVWVVHRPHSLTATDTGLAQDPPIAVCCKPAPPVVRFASGGRYLDGWGGPDSAPSVDGVSQWPSSLHGIFVDKAGSIWFGGNGKGDHVVLNYSADGRYIRSFGRRDRTGGNDATDLLGNPSDVNHSEDMVLISDGYINRRVIGFDAKSNAYRGRWGAYGKPPVAPTRTGDFDQSHAVDPGKVADPKAPIFADIVHCVVPTRDGHVYVCDRNNNRAQLFRRGKNGDLIFVRDLVIAGDTGGTHTVTDIAFSPDPDQTYLYVADMMNGRIWILRRATHEVLGAIGRVGRQAGQFTWLHSIDTDSQGNLYATEVNTGRRVQKLVFTGIQ
jgi:DNA-binding beta-propeller fold protein YncE